jgi:modulator of FtsH protease HflC
MLSDRQREAKELRAQGFEWAQKIQAAADRERTTMLADADEQSTITRGEGEAEGDEVTSEAYDRDPPSSGSTPLWSEPWLYCGLAGAAPAGAPPAGAPSAGAPPPGAIS